MSDNTVIVREYHQTLAAESMHGVPRFGASSNFADLFKSKPAAERYISGLLFAGIFLFTVFLAWSLVLLVFKCLGKRKVGFLSGHAFKRTNSKCNRPFTSRLVFLNATLLFITLSVLFVTKGLTNLRITAKTVADTARDVATIMEQVGSIMDRVEEIGNNTKVITKVFVSRLDKGGEECLLAQFPNASQTIEAAKARIQELRNFTPVELPEMQNVTTVFVNASAQIEKQAENVEISSWQSILVLVPYTAVPVFLLIAVCLAWSDVDVPLLRSAVSWFFLPLFCIMTLAACVASCLFAMAAAGNADFCTGGESQSPDGTVIEILKALDVRGEDLVFKVAKWYIGQCATSQDPFDFLDLYGEQLADAKVELEQLVFEAENSTNTFVSEFCQAESQVLDGLSREVTKNLAALVGVVDDSLQLLSCKNVVGLYTPLVYDGTCTYSINGFTWAFGCFAAVGALGLIMIMLRSSWQLDVPSDNQVLPKLEGPTNDVDYDNDDYDGFKGYTAGNKGAEDADEDGQEQPVGGGAYGTLDDDGDDLYGGMDANTDSNINDADDDFFTKRAAEKGGADVY